MGNVTSTQALESKADHLQRLAGAEHIDSQDNFWIEFFDFKGVSLTQFDPNELAQPLTLHCVGLESNNASTRNFHTMILRLAETIRASKNPASVPLRAVNAATLAQVFIEHAASTLDKAEMAAFTADPAGLGQPSPPDSPPGPPNSVLRMVVRTLAEYLSAEEPGDTSYLLMLQVTRLLLAMTSTQLFTPSPSSERGAHPFTDALFEECQGSSLASRLVEALLLRVVERHPPPAGSLVWEPPADEGPRSTASYVAGAMSSLALAPLSAVAYSARAVGLLGGEEGMAHLGTESLKLLLVLVHHAPWGGKGNPFRLALGRLGDAEGGDGAAASAAEMGAAAGEGRGGPRVPFRGLFEAVCQHMDTELATLLLYSLLHGSRMFADFVTRSGEVAGLMTPLLHSLYAIASKSTSQLYLLLIILLMLTQNQALTRALHAERVASVPWFKERMLSDVPLESLAMLVLMRTAHYNMAHLKDEFVQNNTQAVMANLAPTLRGMVPYAAQRLLDLLELCVKKIAVLNSRVVESMNGEREDSPDGLMAQLGVYRGCLNVLLEIVNNTLRASLLENPDLVYAILRKQEVLSRAEEVQGAAARVVGADDEELEATRGLLANMGQVAGYFQAAVDRELHALLESQRTTEQVMAVIRGHLQGPSVPRDLILHHEVAELTFSYEEEASPEEFFVPYVWSVVMETSPAMTCDRGRIQIFSSAQEAPAGDKVEGGSGGGTGRGSAGERGAGDDDGAEV